MNHFKKIREKLAENGLDAILLTGEANRFYASGFHSSGTDGVAVVTGEKSYYLTDARYIEAAMRHVQGAEVQLVSRGHSYAFLLGEILEKHAIGRLGFEDAYMTVGDYERYRAKLPCTLVPATSLLSALRAVKDEEELSILTAAQRITERAYHEVLNEIHVGVTEKELAARLTYLMLHYGGEKMSFDPIVLSGPNGSVPHGVPTERAVGAGEFVTMDFGCVYRGYCADMTRTVAVGYATGEMQLVYRTVLLAQRAGIAAAHAGATGRSIDGAARAVIAAAGYGDCFGHSFGHGVGVEVHEAPNASPSGENPLPAGAVISAEPGIYLPEKLGVRIEDVLVLGEGSCLNLTKAPKELLIL